MTDTSWVDLLADNTVNRRQIQVSDYTPQRGQSEAHIFRCQVASLLKDKHRLTQDALKSRVLTASLEQEVRELKAQLKDSRCQSEEVCLVLEEQSKLISELSEFKSTGHNELGQAQNTIRALEQSVSEKDKALEGVYAQVQELRSEVSRLTQHLESLQSHNSQLEDVEHQTLSNAAVSEELLATQHSRLLLEKEVLTLKQRLIKETTSRQELEQRLQDQSKVMESLSLKEVELSTVQEELKQLKDSQLVSINAKCREVDMLRVQVEKQLKLEQHERAQLEGQLTAERQERAQLEGQLTAERQERAQLQGQLTAEKQERAQLAKGLNELTQQLLKKQTLCEELKKECNRSYERVQQLEQHNQAQNAVVENIKGQLESTANKLEAVTNELEATKTDKMLLKQKVCDVETQLESARGQLVSRAQLTEEMKTLLDQRAVRIKQLERSLDRQKEQFSISMETTGDLLNASKESLGSELSVSSSVTSNRRSPARFSTAQAEIAHLKQRLAESRQSSIRLEVQCAQLRAEGARLLGSQQALLAIREQLLARNSSLDKGQRSSRETWEKEKNDMSNQISMLYNELNMTRELISARNSANKRVTAMEIELNQSKQEIANVQSELSHKTLDLERVTLQLSHVTSLMDSESVFLSSTTQQLVSDILTESTKGMQLKDEATLSEAINDKRRLQIQERERGVSRLLADLEVLRSRKKVLMKHMSLSSYDGVSMLKARLKREREQTKFVRLRLGYVLGELRLYKQLKAAMEMRVHEMESGLENLQHQHFLCVEKLRQAELLGFTVA